MLGMVVRALSVSIGIVLFIAIRPIFAASDSLWSAGQNFRTEISGSVRSRDNCISVSGQVMQSSGATKTESLCQWTGKNLTLAIYIDSSNYKHYAVKVGFDQVYRNIADIDAYDTRIYLRPADDALIIQFPGAQTASKSSFSVFPFNDGGLLADWLSGIGVWQYHLNFDARTTLMGLTKPDGSLYYEFQNGYVFSDNREYILSWFGDVAAMVVVNTITGEMRIVAALYTSGVIDATISDDGRYAVLGTMGQLYDTKDCGATYDYTMHISRSHHVNFTQGCPMTYLWDTIYGVKNIGGSIGANFYFTDDNKVLAFDYPRYNPSTHVMIESENYDPQQLDYLALGDSYSSGEGDVGVTADGGSYYTPVTNTEGGCHLSTRSYPYLLRDAWGINEDKMASVACSGAKVMPDYIGYSGNYLGQAGRLSGIDSDRLEYLRNRALEVFIPGYVTQIEFVKKYQPKVVTLTGGGNDIGFGNIIEGCAQSTDTCSYADESSDLSHVLDRAIDSQATNLESLIQLVKKYSPNTQIIVVGYPEFISSEGICLFNSALLNKSERIRINQAVDRLNTTLRNEAARAGVKYADVQNSLDGGRLCEGSEYMTGVWAIGLNNAMDSAQIYERAQLFHPNAEGHRQIEKAIIANTYVPTLDTSSKNSTTIIARMVSFVDAIITTISGKIRSIQMPSLSFEPNSEVTITAYSTPTVLGRAIAESDGSLKFDADFSALKFGYHTVVLQGKSFSGESISYYQFVTIAVLYEDIDGDGVDNANDPCSFIDKWNDERTGINVCNVIQENNNAIDSDNPNDKYDLTSSLIGDSMNRDFYAEDIGMISGGTNLQSNRSIGTESTSGIIKEMTDNAQIKNREGAQFAETASFLIASIIISLGVIYSVKKFK